jgi:hypothetical protein
MEKISNEKVAAVLRDTENALRAMAAERDDAVTKLAAVKQNHECQKLAAVMHQKGINTDTDFETLVESLEKSAEQGRLPIIQEAVGMMGGQMSFANLNNDAPVAQSGAGESNLTQYILGNVG